MKRLLFILFIISMNLTYAQSNLPEKDAFAFFMKVYNHKPLDNTNNRSINYGQYRWFDLYLLKFYGYEYNQVKNNEFKVQKFLNRIVSELENKIWTVDHNKIYTQTVKATFGKYDFSKGSFPIHYRMTDFKGAKDFKGGFRINIENIINKSSINAELKMNNTEAENFVNNRKKSNGNVNRKIYLKFYFKVTNINNLIKSPQGGVNGYDKNDLTIEVSKIEVSNNEYSTNVIQNIVVVTDENPYLKSKIIGKWVDIKYNYQTEYKTDNSFYVNNINKDDVSGTYWFVNNIVIRKRNNGITKAYKVKIEGDKLYISYLNKYGKWTYAWTHKRIN